MSDKTSFPKEKIKILLLEGIHPGAEVCFRAAGYEVELRAEALDEKELKKQVAGVHILGIRSKTNVTSSVISEAKHLLALGCFCIGTNQVALESAAANGTPVFNAPFSNTRSVAELSMAEIVMLARSASEKNIKMHRGQWEKSAKGCVEVKGKTLGIVGYGHIGPQVGLLAEAFGMKVVFYDIEKKLPLSAARSLSSLDELLAISDFVTLHVPETELTKNMLDKKRISLMKDGAYLLNLSRGTVVDLSALKDALVEKKLAGASLDVYPQEPKSNKEGFSHELAEFDNVILTPHIGGSTEEAQANIGTEVADSLIKYLETGSSAGAVNFPEIQLPLLGDAHRVLNIHKNIPGVLSQINSIVAEMKVNIRAQYLNTRGDVGYLIMDVDKNISHAVKQNIDKLDANIRTRLLF